MEEKFSQVLSQNGIDLSTFQKAQFERYFELLIQWNAKMNLTAITEKDLVYKKHFLDSASIAVFMDFNSIETLCDVGSGAGFPAIVLKILFPHLKVTIIEALNKRIIFLQALVEELQLDNIELIHSRAEDYAKKEREKFDIVTARAVAKLKMLAELCVPMVKKDGLFIAMKGSQGDQEYNDAKNIFVDLGITKVVAESFSLLEEEQRIIYFCHKTVATPVKYPRAFAQIKKDNQ